VVPAGSWGDFRGAESSPPPVYYLNISSISLLLSQGLDFIMLRRSFSPIETVIMLKLSQGKGIGVPQLKSK
jgi:hypothetical protein